MHTAYIDLMRYLYALFIFFTVFRNSSVYHVQTTGQQTIYAKKSL